jgi:hypothetical protein
VARPAKQLRASAHWLRLLLDQILSLLHDCQWTADMHFKRKTPVCKDSDLNHMCFGRAHPSAHQLRDTIELGVPLVEHMHRGIDCSL